jgi:hypothetical protein
VRCLVLGSVRNLRNYTSMAVVMETGEADEDGKREKKEQNNKMTTSRSRINCYSDHVNRCEIIEDEEAE